MSSRRRVQDRDKDRDSRRTPSTSSNDNSRRNSNSNNKSLTHRHTHSTSTSTDTDKDTSKTELVVLRRTDLPMTISGQQKMGHWRALRVMRRTTIGTLSSSSNTTSVSRMCSRTCSISSSTHNMVVRTVEAIVGRIERRMLRLSGMEAMLCRL